jgi:uncharacterized protein YbjT (DUF2867 family)
MTVLVTGGTGTLGRQLVPRLRGAGVDVRVMSRRGGDARADLASGGGLSEAVAGCDTIVHLATGVRRLYSAIREVDVRGTARLIELAEAGRVQHIVYVSIVGVDRIPFVYYRAKLEAEQLLENQSHVGWSILRATQFHELLDLYCRALRWLPAVPIPRAVACQPVDSGEVADPSVRSCAGGSISPSAGLRRTGGSVGRGSCPCLVDGDRPAPRSRRGAAVWPCYCWISGRSPHGARMSRRTGDLACLARASLCGSKGPKASLTA